jgi:hypothetical protein
MLILYLPHMKDSPYFGVRHRPDDLSSGRCLTPKPPADPADSTILPYILCIDRKTTAFKTIPGSDIVRLFRGQTSGEHGDGEAAPAKRCFVGQA